jgi:hypothetical protein
MLSMRVAVSLRHVLVVGAVAVVGIAGLLSIWYGCADHEDVEVAPPVVTIVPAAPAIEVPLEEPVTSRRGLCDCAGIASRGKTIQQQRTLDLACRLFSDELCYEFEPFAQLEHRGAQGALSAVIVKRQTGACGGCGSLAIASVFRDGRLVALGELGRFGRFGNGPDSARWIAIAGEPALEVTSSMSMGGYSDEYREIFLREDDGWKPALCVVSEADDAGAHEDSSHWRAKLTYRTDGALTIAYEMLKRGETIPKLDPITIGFDPRARTFISDTSESGCLRPPARN